MFGPNFTFPSLRICQPLLGYSGHAEVKVITQPLFTGLRGAVWEEAPQPISFVEFQSKSTADIKRVVFGGLIRGSRSGQGTDYSTWLENQLA